MEPNNPITSREVFAEIKAIHDSLLRVDVGVPYLDDALLGFFPGELTLMGARTGGGKTELAVQVLLTQQTNGRAKSVLYFALDHEPGEIEKRLTWRLLVQRIKAEKPEEFRNVNLRYAAWRAGHYLDLTRRYENEARFQVESLLQTSETKFVYQKKITAKEIAAVIKSQNFPYDFNLCIVDHFHGLKFNTKDLFEAQSEAIRDLSGAAEESQRPVLVMGQFKKRGGVRTPVPDIEEFSGHSDLGYVPQNVVVFGPNAKEGADKWETMFHVVKSRFAGDAKAFVGCHSFDVEAKNYSPAYTVKRFKHFSEPEDLRPLEIPRWAKRAVRPPAYIKGAPPLSWEKNE